LLVFSGNIQYTRVGMVAALWAAAVGALAMTKYRRESQVAGAKLRDLKTVYELQLEREVATRREFELGVEARVRRDMRVEADELAGLRAELNALRANLERLFDGELPVDRPALRADTARAAELPWGAPYAGFAGRAAYPPQPVFTGSAAGAAFASPYDDPVTAETSSVPQPEHSAPREPEAAPPTGGWAVRVADSPAAEAPPWKLDSWRQDGWNTGYGAPNVAQRPESEPMRLLEVTMPALPAFDAEDRGARPERPVAGSGDDGSHTTGLTVAQIMANLRSEVGARECGPEF
jgi:hypothetical protein